MGEKESKINILLMEGITIFFVMFVHSGTPNQVYAFFSYGLSAMCFARGYQWRDRTFKELVKSRLQLVKTYYFAGLVNTLLFLIIPSRFLPISKGSYFLNFVIGRLDRLDQIPITVVQFWFFLMLFFAEIFYWIFEKNKFLLSASLVLSLLLRLIPHAPVPLKLDAALCTIPFFVMGKIWKKNKYVVKRTDFLLSIVGLILISQTNGDISWNNQWFGKNGLIAFLGEILGALIIIYLAEIVKMLKIDKFFYKIAFNSLFVISYHMLLESIISIPFIFLVGNISDPMFAIHKFWYVIFPLVLISVFACLKFIPQRIRNFLIGDFKRMKKGVRSS